MAALTQIIIIIACAIILADCKLRGKFSNIQKKTQEVNSDADAEQQVLDKKKTSDTSRVVPGVNIQDSDAIFFPSDDDTRRYLDVNKIVSENLSAMDNKKRNDVVRITTDTPLLPKVVPAVEAKEVFTNPIPTEEVTYDTIKNKDNIQISPRLIQNPKETKVSEANVTQDNDDVTNSNITKVANMENDTTRSTETKPDFTSRFGDTTSSYMLVPVNNVQSYQPIQTNPNLQSNIPQYGPNNDQGNMLQYPIVTNAADNSQYIPQNTNANYNGYLPKGTDIVPITVSNTYMINGQLYAALTVPNNMNVPSSIYLINPQLPQSSYQVANNLPVYKVMEGDGYNVNNVQFAPVN